MIYSSLFVRVRRNVALIAISLSVVSSFAGAGWSAETKATGEAKSSAYQSPPKTIGDEVIELEPVAPRLLQAEWAVPDEGDLAPFLEKRELDRQVVFSGGRFPNVMVAADGTVVVTWGNQKYRTRRSLDGGGILGRRGGRGRSGISRWRRGGG